MASVSQVQDFFKYKKRAGKKGASFELIQYFSSRSISQTMDCILLWALCVIDEFFTVAVFFHFKEKTYFQCPLETSPTSQWTDISFECFRPLAA